MHKLIIRVWHEALEISNTVNDGILYIIHSVIIRNFEPGRLEHGTFPWHNHVIHLGVCDCESMISKCKDTGL